MFANHSFMTKGTQLRKRIAEILIHLFSWGIIFGYPMWATRNEPIEYDWIDHLLHFGKMFFGSFIIFYINYLYLVPKLVFEKQIKKHLFYNLLIIICLLGIMHWWQNTFIVSLFDSYGNPSHRSMPPPPHLMPIFNIRDAFTMFLTVGLSVAIRLSIRWEQIENLRLETEQTRVESELKNLRNQLNPHFLLNTLNNIYALIAFDAEKAQTAVSELSKLLRHMLYENQGKFVPLSKELDFIQNYIELMKIRLAPHVKVETYLELNKDSQTLIAPFIFISPIENAFKHGISPTEKSYIDIVIGENENEIYCNIRNSYHPKTLEDKSGSGIGLEQLDKSLELTYPNQYVWEKGISTNKQEYFSKIIIYKRNDNPKHS